MSAGDRNFSNCTVCGVLFENPGERFTTCPKHRRESMVEKAQREVAETVQANHDTQHRALDAKYNLLRVSERRWSIVRVASVAAVYHGLADVITFEQVTKPLTYDAALIELRERRRKK